jgi:succinylarginine dihydrolase
VSEAFEVNFDGLVGPTHNYAGLSYGNLASQRSRASISNPRAAALQGLAKMKLLADLGLKQAVLPPQERPHLPTLRRLGFAGSDAEVLAQAQRQAPEVLAAACSASSMWVANAATASPAPDTLDGRLHITPANLASQFHRSIEPSTTARALSAIFDDTSAFALHPALPAGWHFSDEGAANHTRLCMSFGSPGIELFVHGRRAFDQAPHGPSRFPARQTLEASQAVARLHGLRPEYTFFLQQNPAAIDAGVFHNDVVAVGNLNVLFFHAATYAEPAALDAVRRRFAQLTGGELALIEVAETQVPLADAVRSYLFNSQLVTLPDRSMSLICPAECVEIESTRRYLDQLTGGGSTPIRSYKAVELRQSMNNGGGPACLRLRIVLTEDQLQRLLPGVLLTDALHAELTAWIERHYRQRLTAEDLADPKLLDESRTALDQLAGILGIGSIYDFQNA